MKKLQSFLLACVVAMGTMPISACNAQQVLTDLERYAPVVTNLLTVACEFTANPLCSTGSTLLSAAEQHVFNLWQAYINAQHKGTITAADWNDLNAAVDTLISNSSDVFSLAHVVNGPHQQEVLAMATATEALLAVIESQLPANPAPNVKAMSARAPRLATFLPPPNVKSGKYDAAWFKQWEKNYNALPAVQLHKMQIKRGSWWARSQAAYDRWAVQLCARTRPIEECDPNWKPCPGDTRPGTNCEKML